MNEVSVYSDECHDVKKLQIPLEAPESSLEVAAVHGPRDAAAAGESMSGFRIDVAEGLLAPCTSPSTIEISVRNLSM